MIVNWTMWTSNTCTLYQVCSASSWGWDVSRNKPKALCPWIWCHIPQDVLALKDMMILAQSTCTQPRWLQTLSQPPDTNFLSRAAACDETPPHFGRSCAILGRKKWFPLVISSLGFSIRNYPTSKPCVPPARWALHWGHCGNKGRSPVFLLQRLPPILLLLLLPPPPSPSSVPGSRKPGSGPEALFRVQKVASFQAPRFRRHLCRYWIVG